MVSEIKRYDPVTLSGQFSVEHIERRHHGNYVRYKDHLAEVERLNNALRKIAKKDDHVNYSQDDYMFDLSDACDIAKKALIGESQ